MVALFSDDIVAKIDALITNIHRRAGNQLAHLVLALPAERADKIPRSLTVLWHRTPASLKFSSLLEAAFRSRCDNFIHQPVFLGLLAIHKKIAIRIFFNFL